MRLQNLSTAWLAQLVLLSIVTDVTTAFADKRTQRTWRNYSTGSTTRVCVSQNSGEIRQDAYGRSLANDSDDKSKISSTNDPLKDAAASCQMNLDPLVICGPSGVGKGTVIEALRKRFPSDAFGFSVSHTTRQPRPGEVHGEHYYFTTQEDIQRDIEEGLFVEHALVHGNYYGTSKQAIEVLQNEKKITILDIDMQGVISVKESGVSAKYVFIAPPSMTELEKRLRGRGTETEEAIERRLGNAAKEIEYGETDGNFDRLFVNTDVEKTVDEMAEILTEWFPQLKKRQTTSNDQSEEANTKLQTKNTEPIQPNPSEKKYDIMSESDKMLTFPSVRVGHDRLQITDRSAHGQGDFKPKHVTYYVVDNEEPDWPHPSSYRDFSETNPNIVLDRDLSDGDTPS